MANILVTGAQGLVGRATLNRLLELNHTPIILIQDRNRKTDEDLMTKVRAKGAEIVGDVRDYDLMRRIVNKYELDYVIHLAAMPIVKLCDSDPKTAYETNVMGTVNLLEAIRSERSRNNRLKKIIVMTSDKAYADSSPPGGYTEDIPFAVTDTYCVSKSCQDMVARSYAKTYDLPICVVRCGNLYGEGDLNLSRLIPGTILRLLGGEQPVLYNDAAEMRREFIYVSDVVDTYLTLLEHGKPGEAYNVGTGQMYRILDVINKIRDKINPDIDIRIVQRDFFEIQEQCLNASKLQSLGWSAKVSLDEGLDKTIGWYKQWKQKVG